MKHKKFLSLALIGIIGLTTLLSGCGKKTSDEPKKLTVKKHQGEEVVSVLTGEKIDDETRDTRPFAIMTENTRDAIPQYGLNSASIIYECPVEGGITRLMAIYESIKGLNKIGNVRSCRPYYVYFASEYDAIYTHFGQSNEGKEALEKGIIDEINGLSSVGNFVFFRTKDKPAPHNAYTNDEGLKKGAEKLKFSLKYDADKYKHFKFASKNKQNMLKNGEDAYKISLYFINNHPQFIYNKDTGLYKRYQFGGEQIDKLDGKAIEVKNIILENVTSEKYDVSKGTLNLGVKGSGTGKFITNGKVVNITWKKAGDTEPTKYFYESGEEIKLNPGKTWISVIEEHGKDKNKITGTQE